MPQPSALITNNPALGYEPGNLIIDAGEITTILESDSADDFTPLIMFMPDTPALSCYVIIAVAGQPIQMSGGAFNCSPVALQYSVDGGTTWASVANFIIAAGLWSGYGPTYYGAQSTSIIVRDAGNTSNVSPECDFTVTNPPMVVELDTVTLGTVTTLGAGSPATATASIASGTLTLGFGIPMGASGGGGVNIAAYGGVTGGPDCTAALNAAIAAAQTLGQEVVIPGGDWWFASPITIPSGPIAIRGHGKGITRLHFEHTGTAFTITQSLLTNRVSLRDFSAYAENGTAATAAVANITFPSASSFGYVNCVIENVEVFGYPNSNNGTSPFPQTWTRGFVLNNCWSAMVSHCSWFGPPSAAGASSAAFVEINGSNDTRIISQQAYYGHALVIQTGYCEGLYLVNPLVVGCDFVFTQTALTGWTGYVSGKTSLLGLWCIGGELNTAVGHMQANTLIDGFVTGCDITRNTGSSGAAVLFNFTDVSRFHFGPCDWTGNPGGADIAIQFNAVNNSSGCSLLGGRFENMATALQIVGSNGTVGGSFTDFNVGNVPLATAVLDGSLASNGNLIRYRVPATSSQPAGIASTKDHVLSGTDGSCLLRTKSIVGGTDYLTVTPASASGASTTTLSTGVYGLTILPTANLYLSPAAQLWLGAQAGGGAVYSATIGGVTVNPGVVNKLWNNGGMVGISAGGGSSPVPPSPLFASTFTAAQPWGDAPANPAIWRHNGGIVPTPPTPLTGLTVSDKFKASGIYSVGEIIQPSVVFDQWPVLQSFLLYVQLVYLAQKGTTWDNIALRSYLDVHLPAGEYYVSQPLIVPEFVRMGGPGRIMRAPYTGDQSNNGTTSVPGPFATNQFLTTVVVAPHGHLSDLNVCVTTDGVFAHRGSGACLGKNWAAQVGAACTVGSGGSGYSVGDIWYAVQPSVSAYWAWEAQVTAVDGNGAITAAVVLQTGAYALPPAALMYNGAAGLQETQWTAANGFSVFDPLHAGCFLQRNVTHADGSESPGTGATLAPTWAPDFSTGGQRYNIGAAISVGITAGRIDITGNVPSTYSADYGPTFAVMLTGLEFEIDEIHTLGGNAGVYGAFAQDCRIKVWNCVECAVPVFLFGCGSWECSNCVFDTCGSLGMIDQSHAVNLQGRSFWEPGNITLNSPLVNSQTAADGKHYALIIGSGSNATFPVCGLDLRFTVQDMGGLPASTIAAYSGYPIGSYPPSQQAATAFVQYLFNSRIDLCVTNKSQYGATPTLMPTSGIYKFGLSVDSGNDFRGSLDTVPTIDGVTPPAALIGTAWAGAFPACAIRVWDGLHSAWLGPMQTAEIFFAGVPVNGTSGTGAGFAGPGSTCVDTVAGSGRRYVNTGTLASPVWS